MYLLPKIIIDALDKQRRSFFWQGGGVKKKYHLVKWDSLCKSMKKSGLGLKDTRKMNLSLLSKWWWRLENEDGIWQRIIKAKYIKSGLISTVKPHLDDSPVWNDLMKVRYIYLAGRKIKVCDGSKTLFWLDCWLNDKPLCTLYPTLFEFSDTKLVTVKKFIELRGSTSFRRWLPSILREQWEDVKRKVFSFPVFMNPDVISWKCSSKGVFTVKSTYGRLTINNVGDAFDRIWKAKLPY